MSNQPDDPVWQRVRLAALAWLGRAWPARCFVCGGPGGEAPLCAACRDEMPWLDAAACPVCALPTGQGEVCGRCLRRPPHFEATRALFRYAPPAREMVLALKGGSGFGLAPYLARGLAALAEEGVDAVLPVPLHDHRIAARGFNQCVEVGRHLARELGLPLWREAVLRDIDTPHQMGARRAVRRRNLRGAFRCVRDCAGLHLLVLDDVMTSGATLDELARTLKLAGAARVSNLVLARAVLRGR